MDKNSIFKRDKRGLSFFGKKVLTITEMDSNTRKNLAGVQMPGKKSIDERNCIIIYICLIYILLNRMRSYDVKIYLNKLVLNPLNAELAAAVYAPKSST